MDGDPQLQAPVVLVVVNRDSADRDLPVVLAAAAGQDHPNTRLVVLSASAGDELPGLVGASAPGAVVRQVPGASWFAGLADEVLRLVEGDPAFFCFVRDGVALEPGAVTALVREAYRSNAGIAGPKIVAWDRPDRLVSAGLVVDKFGERAPIAQPDELDQEQHDAVRDVFALDGACLLVRGDLLRSLGGFDAELDTVGEDLDLCWRAHVAGARVLVVPEAVARQRLTAEGPATDRRRERNRLRTMFGAYSGSHLVRVVPQAVIVTVLEALASLLAGRGRRSLALLAAWVDALRSPGPIGAKRRRVAALRAVPDVDVRRLQLRGSAALLRQFRRVGTDDGRRFTGVRIAGRQVATGVRRAERSSFVALLVLVVVVAGGARSPLLHRMPIVGEVVPLPGGAWSAVRSYLSGWWPFGLGRSAPVPTGVGLVGVAGAVLGGHMALLRTLLVVGPFLAGPWGAWRLARPFRSGAARVAALVVYAGLPLGVNASSTGRLGGLLVWAATPWVAARIARIGGLAPFVARYGLLPAVSGLALLVAVTAALAPAFLVVPVLVAVAFALAGSLSGQRAAALRALGLTIVATAAGGVLLLPWPVVAGSRPGWGLGRATLHDADGLSAWALARFAAGPHGRIGVGALVGAAALVGLALARGERGAWAQRGVVLTAVALVGGWLASRGSLGQRPPTPEAFLAPAAAGLALAVAAGAAEFEHALRGARLSWRQPAVFLGGLGVLVATVPTLGVVAGGRLGLPAADLVRTLRVLPPAAADAEARLVWIGRPATLPGGGWPLGEGLAYELTAGAGPTLADRWNERPLAPEAALGEALALAADGQTDRLGHLLGPAGVRFVIVRTETVAASSATQAGGTALDVALAETAADAERQPATVLASLAGQLDLRVVSLDDARLVVYENTAWLPVRAQLPAAATSASRQAASSALVQADLSGATPVLPSAGDGATAGTGDVAVGTVYAGVPLDERWTLRTASRTVQPEPAFGWAAAYSVGEAGKATLAYHTSPLRRLAVALQVVAWLLVAGLCLPRRVAVDEASSDDTLVPAVRARSRTSPWAADEPLVDVQPVPPEVSPLEPDEGELRWGDEEPSWVPEGGP